MQYERNPALGQEAPEGFKGCVVDVASAADVGEHLQTHETQLIHAALQLAASRVDIPKAERGHPPESPRMKRRDLGQSVVADSREFIRVFWVFCEVRAWNVDAD